MTTLTPTARKLGEQPAFPCQEGATHGKITGGHATEPQRFPGLTKREYLIGQVLAGSMQGKSTAEAIAESAIMQADATLNALAEEQQPAQPKASDEGWIEWNGGFNPVPGEHVLVKFWNGEETSTPAKSDQFVWGDVGNGPVIIAYRIAEEQP